MSLARENMGKLDLKDVDLESLDIGDFIDEDRLSDSEVVAKVMSASCTTCECTCSCSS